MLAVETTGAEVVRAGTSAAVFAAVGLLYVRYGLPRLNRALGFGSWHEGRWARRWNYGLLLAVGVGGVVAVVVGLVAWVTGTTFT
jgi:hypothetical protein